MARHGRGQPNALDRLDAATRDKCLNLMLSGRKGCDAEVAKLAGVSRQAINEYRRRHLSKALELAGQITAAKPIEGDVTAHLARNAQTIKDVAKALPTLAVREQRLAALQDRHDRMAIVMTERADDMATVPGGKSGLLVRQIKQIGSGESAQIVEEYKLDTGLLSEFREHEKQVAMELGQWQESTGNHNDVTVQLMVAIPRDLHDAPAIEAVAEVLPALPETG